MEIVKITKEKKGEYEKFILENGGSFLQSFGWGEFQEVFDRKVFRFFVKDKDEILLSTSVFRYSLPKKKSYLYIPYGPVVKKEVHLDKLEKAFSALLLELKKVAKKNKSIFLKVEQENSPINLKNLKFKKSKKDIQARETLILNIDREEEDILKEMKQKTRYNIRLAKKRGVNIFEVPQKEAAFSMFYGLLEKTSERNTFKLHPKKYYENMVDMFFDGVVQKKTSEAEVSNKSENLSAIGRGGNERKKIYADSTVLSTESGDKQMHQICRFTERLYFAEYKGKILATAMVGFFGNRATFLHGASSDENKNLMAPYLLHWEIIKKVKEAGMKEYDFWGIITKKTDPKKIKAWQGFSRFKEGFGGEVVEYAGAYDFAFSKPWYFLYNLVRRIKNI
jgi:lipid II:glycine glycyltransferase (peptidoglycan interpeptide bridge formation enzyme)